MLRGILGNGKPKAKTDASKTFIPQDYDFSTAPKASHIQMDLDSVANKARELFPGTYNWLFNEVRDWAARKSGNKQIFFIRGRSGVGKTVFMSELARRYYPGMQQYRAQRDKQGPPEHQSIDIVATYFFNKFDLKRANVKILIRSLSDQLRDTVVGFREALLKQESILLKSKDTYVLNEFKLRRLTVEDLFDVLIGKPSRALGEDRRTQIILFDALNVCDRIYLEPLMRMLKNWRELTPDWLRLVVTATINEERVISLSESEIVQNCDIGHDRYRDRVDMDVTKYAKHRLRRELDSVDQAGINHVLRAAESRLLYISVLKVWLNMKPTVNPFEQETLDLPMGMNELYSVLFRTFKEKYTEQYRSFLAPLMATRTPLPSTVWRKCCPEIDESTFNQMLAALDTVLYVQSAAVVFTHRTSYSWLRHHERPKLWLSHMMERSRLFGLEIFSGYVKSGSKDRKRTSLEEDDAVARLGRSMFTKQKSNNVAANFHSVRKVVPREKTNDDLLIKPQLGHRALAKLCWSSYRRGKKEDQEFTITNLIYHLVHCKDEAADVNRDKDASNLLLSFDFNMKRLLGKNVIEDERLINEADHQEGYAANVSGALHDAFIEYLLKHPEDRAVRIVQSAISQGRAALTEDPRQLASQLLARIDFESNQNELGELYKRCLAFDCGVPWWRPVSPNLSRADVSKLLVRNSPKTTYVKCVVVTPDGGSIVAGSNTGMINMYEANGGRSLFSLDTLSKASVNSLDFYYDEDDDELHLASGSSDGVLRIWDIERGILKSSRKIGKKGIAAIGYMQNPNLSIKAIKRKQREQQEVDSLDNDSKPVNDSASDTSEDTDSDDGIAGDSFFEEQVIVGTLGGEVYIYLPDRATQQKIDNVEFPVTAIECGRHSANYHIFAVSTTAGTIIVYDINNQQTRLRMLRHEDRVWDIRLHPTMNQLLSCSEDETVTLWNLEAPEDEDPELRTYKNISSKKNPVMCINFAKDGKHFVTGSKDGKILMVQTYERDEATLSEDDDEDEFKKSENGYVALTNAYRKDPDAEAKALLELGLPEEFSGAKLMIEGHTGWIADVCFFPTSERIVSASKDGKIIFWSYDIRDVFNTEKASPHTLPITSAAFSPENNYFHTGGKDKRIVGWDVRTGEHTFVKTHLYVPRRIVFSHDGVRVGVYTDEDTICLSAKTGKTAHNVGQVHQPDKKSMAKDLSVNDFVTLPLKLPTQLINVGVPFTTDIPRRGHLLLSNSARENVRKGNNKNVYGLVVTKNTVSLLQLMLPSKSISDTKSESDHSDSD